MPNTPTSQGGRPAIGPAISVAYEPELLDNIDRAANREGTTRAAWLRRTAREGVHETLRPLTRPASVLKDLDETLHLTRQSALDTEYDADFRKAQALTYDHTVTELRAFIRQAAALLPVHECEEAMEDLMHDIAEGKPLTAETAHTAGKATAVRTLHQWLQSLSESLPTDADIVLREATDPDFDPLDLP